MNASSKGWKRQIPNEVVEQLIKREKELGPMDCEICRGSQIVRLPLYKRVSARVPESPDVMDTGPSYKEYPCPECTPLVPKEHVRVVECHVEADTRYEGDEDYRRHIVRVAIDHLANEISEHGFARIQTAKADSRNLKRKYRMSIGVVAPRAAAALDAERFAAEEAFASLVVQIAAQSIDIWGKDYGHSEILKRDAKRFLSEAIGKAKETRPKAVA